MLAPIVAVLVMLGIMFIGTALVGSPVKLPSGAGVPKGIGYMGRLRNDLADAGIMDVSPERFVAAQILTGLTVGAVVSALSFALGAQVPFMGVIVGVIVGIFGLQWAVLGPRLDKRRAYITKQVGEAAADMAEQIAAGIDPSKALASYTRRAREDSPVRRVTGEDYVIARILATALNRTSLGITEHDALRAGARDLGNPFFTMFVETYLQLIGKNNSQLGMAMNRLSKQVDHNVRLTDERKGLMTLPTGSYKMIGGITVFVVAVMMVMLPQSRVFFSSLLGQAFAMALAGWWFVGLRLLQGRANAAI